MQDIAVPLMVLAGTLLLSYMVLKFFNFIKINILFIKNESILISTRLHPQGKGGPEGHFLCAENTLNVCHMYYDVTIQNPSIIDLA